jgi:6-phosphogluconolactonase (cycloisomerase 2 family)
MPHALYVCLQDDNKIGVFAIYSESGQLSPRAGVPLAGGPSVMALSPDRQKVYVGTRTEPAILTYGIDQGTGSLTLTGECGDEARADLSRARSHGQVLAVSLLPGRIGGGASNRGGWDRRHSAD